MTPKYLRYIIISSIFFGCQNNHKLDGYYSNCNNGEYAEVYFKNDSMRIASENDWIKLSEWRKFDVVNDTLFFEAFGEWRNPTKAKIKFIGRNKIELSYPKDIDDAEFKLIQSFERIDEDFDFNQPKKFWTKFKERKNSAECKARTEKNAD